MNVYIVLWNTESGDEGVEGYWTEKPSEEQLYAYMLDRFDYEFEIDEDTGRATPYIYWELKELKLQPGWK